MASIEVSTIWRYAYPIGSMYGIYANIGGILMLNITIYGIHGSYGVCIYIYTYVYIYIDVYMYIDNNKCIQTSRIRTLHLIDDNNDKKGKRTSQIVPVDQGSQVTSHVLNGTSQTKYLGIWQQMRGLRLWASEMGTVGQWHDDRLDNSTWKMS